MTRPTFAYVGSRTNAMRKARGVGIGVYAVEPGSWRPLQTLAEPDPSFLTFDSHRRWLYAAQGDGSEVAAFARDPASGLLTPLDRRPSEGLNGVHVAVDPTDRFLVLTNHLTEDGFVSNLTVFPIGEDGSLGAPTDIRRIEGEPGPNRDQQPYAKPHHVQFSPDGRFLAMADKGLDELRLYRLGDDGVLSEIEASRTRYRWGAGPRHVTFHPAGAFLYVLNELDSTITANAFDPASGAVKPFQVVPSQSDAYSRFHRASEIEITRDGRFLYAANRGQNSLGVFAVDAESGRLTALQFVGAGGKIPRHFAFSPDERQVFVANEFSDGVVAFDRGEDGRLTRLGVVAETGTPTCILVA
ncbi:lactonase family protein [Caulobacter sp. KR2-114]|uniref:lactonase family protein n=1 Tax=Caulobacter sp. KR2-114 TaxID=3400912 RepID=UPI003C013614